MIVRVKSAYVDQRGLHRKGDLIDVIKFDPKFHDLIEEKVEKKAEKKPVKASRAKKTKK